MIPFPESGKGTRDASKDRQERPTKQDGNVGAVGAKNIRLPLTVLPKGAIYTFPYVLGLDTYEYDFGQKMAARASKRFQEKVKASCDTGQDLGKAKLARPHCGNTTMVQAGVTGSTAFLLHAVNSSDGGSKIRKRRQKLTDDLLHDLVVSYGDSMDVVHKWFQIFQHYSDPPEEIVLPSLPERREETAPTLGPEKINTSRTASRISTKSTKRSKTLQRPCSAPSLKRPEIVRVPRRKCKDDDFEDDRNELQKTRTLLKEAGLAGPGAGQLDLAHRFRVQNLNDDALSEWLESFTFLWNLQRLPMEALQLHSKSSSPQRRASRFRSKRDVTSRYMTKLNEKVSGLGVWEFGGEFTDTIFDSSATSSATAETEDETEGPLTLQDLTLNQIMLRSSSLAMMNSGIVRKKGQEDGGKFGGKHRSKAAFEEIARSRVEILSLVAPTQMTLKNFIAFISSFGVHRGETIERVAKHLFLSVPRASSPVRSPLSDEEDDKDDHWQDSTTLPFEVFYKFVRALRANPLCSDAYDANHPYIFSDLLCRLVFCALTGHEGVTYTAGAAVAFKDDATLKPVCSQSLFQSLKLFLSDEGLRESSEEVQALSEFVFGALLRSQESLRASGQSGVSFNGFQNFVRQKPQVYLHLVFLLFPLAMRGEQFAAEEMHLMQKGLNHRAGELREKAAALARQLQKRHLSEVFAEFVQPWKEVCRRASRSGKDFSKREE